MHLLLIQKSHLFLLPIWKDIERKTTWLKAQITKNRTLIIKSKHYNFGNSLFELAAKVILNHKDRN